MLTHTIEVHKAPVRIKEERPTFHGVIGSDDHKRFIHSRVLQGCKFLVGEHIKYKGETGFISDIHTEDFFKQVEWNDLECKCVEIFLYDQQEFELVHPNQLKRNR
jgi:hypothetical protein